MKKILVLGLILISVGCSLKDQDKMNREAALAVLKGSYTMGLNAQDFFANTFNGTTGVHINMTVTIYYLEFSVGNVRFEYQDLKDGWIVYKAFLDGTVKYTALAPDSSGNIGMEFTEFRDNMADINPTTGVGHPFLTKSN